MWKIRSDTNYFAFEPGYIANTSRCWESVLSMASKVVIPLGTEFTFNLRNGFLGKFAYIRRGRVHTFIRYKNGTERLKLIVDEGALIYDSYSVAGSAETACTHLAKYEVEMYVFDGSLLRNVSFQKEHPDLLYNVLESTARKYVLFDALIDSMQLATAKERVAWYVSKLSESRSGSLRFSSGLSQNEIASLLGLSKASMTRAVAELKDLGIITDFSWRSITISDREALTAVFS